MGLFDEIKDNPFDREFKTAQKEVSYMLQNIDNVTYHNNGYYWNLTIWYDGKQAVLTEKSFYKKWTYFFLDVL